MDAQSHVDYLAIGHVCYDIVPDGLAVGGTVAFSGRTAQILGCETAVISSSAAEDTWQDVLPGICLQQVVAPTTTTFENVYTSAGRVQTLHAVANKLRAQHVPVEWQRAPIVHLGPIANEIDVDVMQLFSNSMVGLTPQGWMRRWDENGRVFATHWPAAIDVLPLAAAVIISEEDLLDDQMLADYRQWSHLLVMTRGPYGCTVYFGDEERTFPSPKVPVIELTGAGDIFATAFLVRLHQTAGNPWEAARFANEIAAQSIQAAGLQAKMDKIKQNL